MPLLLLLLAFTLAAPDAWAMEAASQTLSLVDHGVGYAAITIFALAYFLVMAEEFTNMRKSKPVIVAAGLIWGMVALVYAQHDITGAVEKAVRHNVLEFAELMLFLLVAMTYINAMEERLVFESLKTWLIQKGFGYRKLFWITGLLTFFMSPIADNLTTALLMGTVVLTVGRDSSKFVALACVNIVVAANAGGAFSPFGDITTLMVWQEGIVDFWTFFYLFVPSLVNFLVPAVIMNFAIPDIKPKVVAESIAVKRGAWVIIFLFLLTIVTAVSFHNFLYIPPMVGMMTGLGYLQIFGFYLRKTHRINQVGYSEVKANEMVGDVTAFEIFRQISRAEWDTLLFFYGVVLCVGGLGFIGYLELVSNLLYIDMGPTYANTMVGVLSAIIDNIPVMFAVITMNPDMSSGQWLLVTLTAGVGGSLLSTGSAAGVALMGQARGFYTFFSHLKWTPVIALGYGASILAHMWINAGHF